MDFDFLKGNIEIIILNSLLSENRYGYEIAQEIKEKTKNQYEIKQPTLYAYLKRLEGRELITSYWGGGDSNGGRRRYYKLTEIGKKTCIDYLSEWNYQRNVMDNITSTNKDLELKILTQAQTTPLFGNKIKKVRSRKELSADELTKINGMIQEIKEKEDNQQLVNKVDATQRFILSEKENKSELSEKRTEKSNDNNEIKLCQTDKTVFADTDKQGASNLQYVSKSVFMAQNISSAVPVGKSDTLIKKQESQAEKQYKQILENILSGQLDNIKNVKSEPQQKEEEIPQQKQVQFTNTPLPLSEIAEKLNAEGVSIKVYSPKNTYKPTPMVFINKLNCLASWAIAVLLGIECLFMYLVFKNYADVNLSPFVIIVTLLLLAPIFLTVNNFHNPTKKVKSKFNFRFNFVNAWIFFAMAFIIDLIVYFLIIGAGNITEFCMYLILPSVLCLNAPLSVYIYHLINKTMLNK